MTLRTPALTSAMLVALAVLGQALPLQAQTLAVDDPVLEAIWEEAMENSHLEPLGHALVDSIGPRLTGSPGIDRAQEWAVATLSGWGIEAYNEEYGTWRGWDRGITHIDLLEPRVRSLEGTMLAWSPGTDGPVTAEVTVPPAAGGAAFDSWLRDEVPGRFVLRQAAQPSCRPDNHFDEWGTPGALSRMEQLRDEAQESFSARLSEDGLSRGDLEEAGAAGILEAGYRGRIGVMPVFGTDTETTPTVIVGCEDYGLLFRLADAGSAPVLRLNAEAEFLGEVPVHNTIGVIRGSELPEEYVLLSAHYDTWDASSGAADNGTGSITMLEVMRILSEVYPNPRRTIMVGLWGGEEQGLNGSRRFAAMHPDVVDGMQALFNQDNGTGRVVNISTQGLVEAGEHWARWLAAVPSEITQHIRLNVPGAPSGGGSDHASFICAGAPAFGLSSISWGYNPYTWHTNRDTYDKIVFEEVRNNAALIAMLTYLASEDPERVSRTRRALPEGASWPECPPGAESFGG
ncbi:MAG: M28 family peptidase [Gemmatimonadota bacterium]